VSVGVEFEADGGGELVVVIVLEVFAGRLLQAAKVNRQSATSASIRLAVDNRARHP
jgi:hypothetical protein